MTCPRFLPRASYRVARCAALHPHPRRSVSRGALHYTSILSLPTFHPLHTNSAHDSSAVTVMGNECTQSVPLWRRRSVRCPSKRLSVGTCLHQLRQEGWTHLASQRTVDCRPKEGVIQLREGYLRYRPRKPGPSEGHAKLSVWPSRSRHQAQGHRLPFSQGTPKGPCQSAPSATA